MNLGLFNVPSSTLTSIKNENLNNGLTKINSNNALIKWIVAITINHQLTPSILYAFIAWKPKSIDCAVTSAAKKENKIKCILRLTRLTKLSIMNKTQINIAARVAIKT